MRVKMSTFNIILCVKKWLNWHLKYYTTYQLPQPFPMFFFFLSFTFALCASQLLVLEEQSFAFYENLGENDVDWIKLLLLDAIDSYCLYI